MNRLLLTPGPLTTSKAVKNAMQIDSCTWDDEYKIIVEGIRSDLLKIAGVDQEKYTVVLMQGSGTFGVEAAINTLIKSDEKLLVLANGAYGERIGEIAHKLNKNVEVYHNDETRVLDVKSVEEYLQNDESIKFVAAVHCETTTGILNNLDELAQVVKKYNKYLIVDAMSSFGGIAIDFQKNDIDCLISSANKCLEGVPGFSFVIVKKTLIEQCENNATSVSLDLYDQWECFEKNAGKWRFTSPTHVVLAFQEALAEFRAEGGVNHRHQRYADNQKMLVELMAEIGFETVIATENQSPIITTFYYYDHPDFTFKGLYDYIKERGFIIYPGKLTNMNIFRIGNIGQVFTEDIKRLVAIINDYVKELDQ